MDSVNDYNGSTSQGPKSMSAPDNGSMNDVKKLKNQIETDVKLLRNRVRMLQQEHEKAQKKITETAKKTSELQLLKAKNDERYIRLVGEKSRKDAEDRQKNIVYYEQQKNR